MILLYMSSCVASLCLLFNKGTIIALLLQKNHWGQLCPINEISEIQYQAENYFSRKVDSLVRNLI